MKDYMKNILEQLENRIECKHHIPFKDELITLLNNLIPEEKLFVIDKFMNLDWHIGSLNVLNILQNSNLLSITEYIVRISNEDNNHVQNLISDLLESNYELLGSILIDSYYNTTSNVLLQTSINDNITLLISQFEHHPNVINENYLTEVKLFVDEDVYREFKYTHLHIFLDSHSISVLNAINEIDEWKAYINSIDGSVFYSILREVIDDIDFIKKMLNLSIDSEFQGWKYFVILLQIATKSDTNSSNDFHLLVKEHLRSVFKDFVKTNSQTLFFTLFICARTLYSLSDNDSLKIICPYSFWFKNTFSDVKYVITTTEFKQLIARLNQLVRTAKEIKYLEAQVKIAINAPAFCNDLVLEYKNNCRMQITSLKEKMNI